MKSNGMFDEEPLVDIFNKVIVGVKTCKKFHHERLSVVLNTWGRLVPHLRMFSDIKGAFYRIQIQQKLLIKKSFVI